MVKIISDSTCDLSQEVLERYDIDIIPLHIVKGDEELEDGPQIDIHALYPMVMVAITILLPAYSITRLVSTLRMNGR